MSIPNFSTQSSFFSPVALGKELLGPTDRYLIFAQKIYPLLVQARSQLISCYCQDNGRPGVEPVLLLGITLMQFMDGVPDVRAVEMLRYHAGWNFALNRQIGEDVFHPTSLVHFRQRLIAHEQSALAFAQIIEGLIAAGLIKRRGAQRLDSTQMFGLVSHMSRLECVRETLRLALQELDESAAAFGRPDFWTELMERYVEHKLDYRSEVAVLQKKMIQGGLDMVRLLEWVDKLSDPHVGAGPTGQIAPACLRRRV